MLDFELPLLSGSAGIGEAFEAMIRKSVSGIVVQVPTGYRLLHYTQVLAASESNLRSLADIPSYLSLPRSVSRSFLGSNDYTLETISLTTATVRSRREPGASPFMAQSPGYSCDGPNPHFYPPQKRRNTNDCVVLACPGKLP
jgi:hypothetical protein